MIEIAIADALANYSVDMESGCWNWGGALNEDGYGQFSVKTSGVSCGITTIKAHRLFYANYSGPLVSGLMLDHACRNRKCVNPEHLEQVTNAENVRRGNSTNLTVEQVAEIRRRYKAGGVSQMSLAKEYSASETCIGSIVRGFSWMAGIDAPVLSVNNPVGRRPKLTTTQVESLIRDYESGTGQCVLAKQYGVSPARVCMYIKERKCSQ